MMTGLHLERIRYTLKGKRSQYDLVWQPFESGRNPLKTESIIIIMTIIVYYRQR